MKRHILIMIVLAFGLSKAYAISQETLAQDFSAAIAVVQTLKIQESDILAQPKQKYQQLCADSATMPDAWPFFVNYQRYEQFADYLFTQSKAENDQNHQPILAELARALSDRGEIFSQRLTRTMHENELRGRLYGNERRIQGIMRAAINAYHGLSSKETLANNAIAKFGAGIENSYFCNGQ